MTSEDAQRQEPSLERPAVPAPTFCGRPTRSGQPCRQRVPDPRFEVACRRHATDSESKLATVRRRSYYDGYRDGGESARDFGRFQIEQLEKQVWELKEAAAPPLRMVDLRGRQIVQIGRYGYTWDGAEPLVVGDKVWLPENYVSRLQNGPGRWRGEVTALGTRYIGALDAIIGRA